MTTWISVGLFAGLSVFLLGACQPYAGQSRRTSTLPGGESVRETPPTSTPTSASASAQPAGDQADAPARPAPAPIVFSAPAHAAYGAVLGVDPKAAEPVVAGGPAVSLDGMLPDVWSVTSVTADRDASSTIRARLTPLGATGFRVEHIVAPGVGDEPREVHLRQGIWQVVGPALPPQAADALLNLVRDATLLRGLLGPGSVRVGDQRSLAGEIFRCVRTTATSAWLASTSEYGWPGADANHYPSAPGVIHHLRIEHDPAGGLRGLERCLGVCDADGATIQLRRTRFDFSSSGTP